MIGGVIVAVLALVISRPWQKAAVSPDAAKPAEAAKPAAPLTEAQKLVAQARKIYEDGDELNRDNLFLAEELVQRALAVDPAEPSAVQVATHSPLPFGSHDALEVAAPVCVDFVGSIILNGSSAGIRKPPSANRAGSTR